VPIGAALSLVLIVAIPAALDYFTIDHPHYEPAPDPPVQLTLEELGTRKPNEPMAQGFDLNRLSLGVPHKGTRPITPSAEGQGGSAVGRQ
jgi:hypothetical protein